MLCEYELCSLLCRYVDKHYKKQSPKHPLMRVVGLLDFNCALVPREEYKPFGYVIYKLVEILFSCFRKTRNICFKMIFATDI